MAASTLKPRGIFYGWIIVLCGGVLLALGIGMFASTTSMFVRPVCESLGFSRGAFTFYVTIVLVTATLLMPFYGRLIQKIGVKKILLAAVVMLGLVVTAFSFSTKLWHFYALAVVNGLFVNGISFMSIGVLVSAWFKDKKGLATGLAYAGSGLGGAIMIPVVGRIIEAASWRWAYRFMAITGIALMVPVIIFLVKNTPEEIGLRPLGRKETEEAGQEDSASFTFKEALLSGKFLPLLIAFFFIGIFSSASNTHSSAYLSDLGYDTAYVSSVISLFMIFLSLGKIILGSIYDRFGTRAGSAVVSFFCLLFPVFALLSRIPAMAYTYAVFIGMASCGMSIPIPILVNKHFGAREFPRIFSFCMMISSLAQAVSVPLMGAVYDFTGSYRPGWIAFIAGSIIITFCLMKVEFSKK